MISVKRKLFLIDLIDVFLAEEYKPKQTKKKLIIYHYSRVPGQNLFKEITYQINLENDENEFFQRMSKKSRSKLRRAKKEPYEVIVKDNPTDEDLKEFRQFYNKFARYKKIHNINKFRFNRLKLLRNKGVLVFTKLQNTNQEALCYQIRMIDKEMVLSLYGCTASWIRNRSDLKQQIRYANRYLLWENLIMFKKRGYKIYDFGGITNNKDINRFKEDFGFDNVEAYHGFDTESLIGKILIRLHQRKNIYLFA
ncbi:hypothetical protein [Ureibacillus aquaedulcis]|uniref:Lipid II:glycine glycyltransferase n=1 Tax=Ureibacillus aquaedulcis TaxID=3058421 RepID=A0ABT8GUL0_9BACL|nr:hypothetical protein [Ureibacillus sp. BA0131]MDN4495098.1 hypothetical protein [Ureibacillus sp. BA0131]